MNKKQKKSLKRIIISAVLLIIAAVLSQFTDITLVRIGLFAVPYLVVGWNVLKESFSKLLRGQMMDENFLMSIATIGAFILGEYLEGVAVMLFFNIGELFESYAVGNSRKSIAALMDIRPEHANLVQGDSVSVVDPEQLKAEDIILIKPGERVPVDGAVTEGSSALDTSALTGEAVPKNVQEGSEIISGCINLNGVLKVRVTKTYENSTVAKILELVENSSLSKSKSESFITRFARVYTPLVVAVAAALAIIPPIFAGDFAKWFSKALIFLVVSCPCALVISVPLSFFSGIGAASKNGILIKGSSYLEKMAGIYAMIFDKTGTLTKGIFSVTEVCPENIDKDELIELAASAEKFSTHPIAKSITDEYGKSEFSQDITDAKELAGYGIYATGENTVILAGNSKLMEKYGIEYKDSKENGTVVHVAQDGIYKGYIVISDVIKQEAKQAVKELKRQGVDITVILTGDKEETGKAVAEALGIDKVHCELLPADKVEYMKSYIGSKKKNKNVVFAGDGINDAPVLALADAGISMGAMGSDAAIEAADIVLMNDDISKIPLAVKISRKTLAIVKQNIIFALGIKLLVMLLTVIGCSNMWQAVFADVGVSVIAILNATRALRIK
ncbi:MAG: cadmium-translocating P-type ATPase [Clostridia bacterium]|nr:cadmium-translocating P-type ATPase [Clostridia bacterium]